VRIVGRTHLLSGDPAPPAPDPITLSPPQPFAVVYGDMVGLSAYNHPGALIFAGRDNYNTTEMLAAQAAGATVLIYLDAMLDNPYGTYHNLLINSSVYGAAVPRFNGTLPQANDTGYLADIRVGGIMQGKLENVLEKMVSDNPHMGGFFLDDVGSRSWFPGHNWSTNFTSTDRTDYRNGAIQIVQTARTVADRHGLIVIVNGTWTAGTLASNGGGYPTLTTHGCSLAEGGMVEHHDGEIAFWGGYGAPTSQWGNDSPITEGVPMCPVICSDLTGVAEYAGNGNFPFITPQDDYGITPTPWTTFHPTGLPTHPS
jgi:hypothetical protein